VARRKSPPSRNGTAHPADAPPENDSLDFDDSPVVDGGAIPISIESPRQEAEPVHATPHGPANVVEPPRAPLSNSQPSPVVTSIQHTGLGLKQVVLLVLTMVFIAVAVSAAVTLYVTRGAHPPAAETTQP
jgi:hypothetical protein